MHRMLQNSNNEYLQLLNCYDENAGLCSKRNDSCSVEYKLYQNNMIKIIISTQDKGHTSFMTVNILTQNTTNAGLV
jgi:hypothetical protein